MPFSRSDIHPGAQGGCDFCPVAIGTRAYETPVSICNGGCTMKLTGKRSLHSKLIRMADELDNDADRAGGNHELRLALRRLAQDHREVAANVEDRVNAKAWERLHGG